MSYYILPKNKADYKIELVYNANELTPYISYSLYSYINNIKNQLVNIENKSKIEFLNKIINPFEFIVTNIPNSSQSVSKINPGSNFFFELIELVQQCNLNIFFSTQNNLNIINFTTNQLSNIYLYNLLRNGKNDLIVNEDFELSTIYEKYLNNKIEITNKIDLLVFEFKESDYLEQDKYIKNLIVVLLIVLKYQNNNGLTIIKISDIFYKPIIDILYIFSGLFKEVYLCKPIISNIIKSDKFIVCNNFSQTNKDSLFNVLNYNLINNNSNIQSILNNNIPCIFINRIEEFNVIVGQQQLESNIQIINIFRNKNNDDKIEVLKRNHIQRCIQWCDKNKLPYNKFIDKTNMFLLDISNNTQEFKVE